MLVGETRLQDTITGPARATVTSVLGLLEELVALAVYAAFALGAHVARLPGPGRAAGGPVPSSWPAPWRGICPGGRGPSRILPSTCPPVLT